METAVGKQRKLISLPTEGLESGWLGTVLHHNSMQYRLLTFLETANTETLTKALTVLEKQGFIL